MRAQEGSARVQTVRTEKRHSSAALHDAAATANGHSTTRSVVECGAAVPLSFAETSWTPRTPWKLLQFLNPNIFELHGHWRSRVQLKREHAFLQPLGLAIVGHLNRFRAVDLVHELVPACDDHVIIPIAGLDLCLDVVRLAQRTGDVLFAI